METKYRFLRTAATIFKVIGWIVLVVGIIGSIVLSIVMGTQLPEFGGFGAFYAIFGIVYSVIGWVSLLAFAQIIYLLIDIEQKTRETAEHFRTGSTGKLT